MSNLNNFFCTASKALIVDAFDSSTTSSYRGMIIVVSSQIQTNKTINKETQCTSNRSSSHLKNNTKRHEIAIQILCITV